MKRILTVLVLLSIFIQSVSAVVIFNVPSNAATLITDVTPTLSAGPTFAAIAGGVTCDTVGPTGCCGTTACTVASAGVTFTSAPNLTESSTIIVAKQGGKALTDVFIETLFSEVEPGVPPGIIPQCDDCRPCDQCELKGASLWQNGIAGAVVDRNDHPGIVIYNYITGVYTIWTSSTMTGYNPVGFSADEDGTTGCAVFEASANDNISIARMNLNTPTAFFVGEYTTFGDPSDIEVSAAGSKAAIAGGGPSDDRARALQITTLTGAVDGSLDVNNAAATAGDVNFFRAVEEASTANNFIFAGSLYDETNARKNGVGIGLTTNFAGVDDVLGLAVAANDLDFYDIKLLTGQGNDIMVAGERNAGGGAQRIVYGFMLTGFTAFAPQGSFEAGAESAAQFISLFNSNADFCIAGDTSTGAATQNLVYACGDGATGSTSASQVVDVSTAQTTTLSITSDPQTVKGTGETWEHLFANDGNGDIVQVALDTNANSEFAIKYNSQDGDNTVTYGVALPFGSFDQFLFAMGGSSESGSGSTVPTSATPEFSATTLLLAVLLAGGFIVFVVRRRRY